MEIKPLQGVHISWKSTRLLWVVVIVVLVLGFVSTLLDSVESPMRGTLAATVFETGAPPHALNISVRDLTSITPTYHANQAALLLAAIPSPTGREAAFVTSVRGKRVLSIGDPAGVQVVDLMEGHVDTPAWSEDGSNVLFALYDGEDGDGGLEQWTIYRASGTGDPTLVGKGYYPFAAANQRAFALTPAGIVLYTFNDPNPTLIVASPVPVPVTTPFAASEDGMRVAWVSPGDKSFQVFENEHGIFVPRLVTSALRPQSFTFSPDGAYVIGTTHTEATTTLHFIEIDGGGVHQVGELSGYIRLHAWRNE